MSRLSIFIQYHSITWERFPWLDVVDAEVRLSKEEVDAMIATYLDPAMAEVFLRPLRASREL